MTTPAPADDLDTLLRNARQRVGEEAVFLARQRASRETLRVLRVAPTWTGAQFMDAYVVAFADELRQLLRSPP